MYKTSCLIILLLLIQNPVFSQTTSTKYYKDIYLRKEVSPSKASYSLTMTQLPDGKWMREVKDVKNGFVVKKETDNGEQQGIWHHRRRNAYVDLNYDFSLSYSAATCSDSVDGVYISDFFTDSLGIDYVGAKIMNETNTAVVLSMEDVLMHHLAENTVYPQYAMENGLSGKVVLTFLVSANGIAEDIKVMRGVHPSLDKEAVRVVRLLKFVPARCKGQAVDFCMSLPIVFALEE